MFDRPRDIDQRLALIDSRRRCREAEDRAAAQLAGFALVALVSFALLYSFSFAVM